LFSKTVEGYSLTETLISLFLLSLLVIVYSNLSALHHTQTAREQLIHHLYTDAHSIAVIIEDKNILQIPLDLFTSTSPVPLAFLAVNNHTIEMTLPLFASLFGVTLPQELLNDDHTIVCTFVLQQFCGLAFTQMHVYLLARFNKKIVYGFSSFVF
jgi:hypothetical protein